MDLYHFADETKNSKLEEESNDGQEVKAELTEDVKSFVVTKEDENVGRKTFGKTRLLGRHYLP